MALPFRRQKAVPHPPTRRSAVECVTRLETSPLVLRREREFRETHDLAKRRAFAYVDNQTQPVKWAGER